MLQDAAIGGPIMQVFVLGIDANLFVETLVFGRQHFYLSTPVISASI